MAKGIIGELEGITKKDFKTRNKILFCDDIIKVYMKNGEYFIADAIDYQKVKERTWHVDSTTKHVVAREFGMNKTITLTRYLLDYDGENVIDHINGDPLDNRRCNLRICTHQQNMFNSKINKRNTTGHKGVSYDKAQNRYVAYIRKDKTYRKAFTISKYSSQNEAFEEACKWQEEMSNKLFGEFSFYNRLNT